MAADGRGVLVTGGAGYIGSHAAKALQRAGYRVVVYDNLVAGHRGAVKYGELVVGDITDGAAVRAAIRRHDIFAVMHFAAFLDVGESVRDPAKYYRNNVVGALAVLDAMAAESTRHFVFSSTCATYGEPIETPIAETHPQRPINSYGESKLAVERALPHFERAYGMRWAALRYFNASGADPDGEIGEDLVRPQRVAHRGQIGDIAHFERAELRRGAVAGNQVVEDDDAMPGALQRLRGMAADVAGAARDEHRPPVSVQWRNT